MPSTFPIKINVQINIINTVTTIINNIKNRFVLSEISNIDPSNIIIKRK